MSSSTSSGTSPATSAGPTGLPHSAREGTDLANDAGVLHALHRTMVLAEALDECLSAEVRRGSLEHWKASGAEAVLVGATSALAVGDWLFAGALDFAAAVARGVSLEKALRHVFATAGDPTKGRAPAPSLAMRTPALGSYGFHNGAHLTHAAGVAWAAKIRKESTVALALFDEAEIAGGEFHNAMNFVGVFKLPVVLVAVRRTEMRVGAAPRDRGIAYGVPTDTCDGNDVLSVRASVARAIDAARAGKGPTLVDATLDHEPAERARVRFEKALAARGIPVDGDATHEAVVREIDEAIAVASASSAPPVGTMFDDVYEVAPSHLAEQRETMSTERG